jgi:hypothetical protein
MTSLLLMCVCFSNVRDAETEVLILRVGSKKDPAELKFPLRSSERNYDHPNFLYKWHTLQSASGQQLQLQVYIQYVDRRQYSAPTDFKHNMHVGWTPSGGFDVRNIPKEWMTLFQKAGITKDELSNPETAAMLYNKIKQYEQENHIQVPHSFKLTFPSTKHIHTPSLLFSSLLFSSLLFLFLIVCLYVLCVVNHIIHTVRSECTAATTASASSILKQGRHNFASFASSSNSCCKYYNEY